MLQLRLAPIVVALAFAAGLSTLAQKAYTAKDYAQAEKWMGYTVAPLVHHTIGDVAHLPDGRVFYRDPGASETAYMLADPRTRQTAPAFNNAKLAAALVSASHRSFTPQQLGVSSFQPAMGGGFAITARGLSFHCEPAAVRCREDVPPPATGQQQPAANRSSAPYDESPDGRYQAFVRDWNLWVRDTASGKERPLTTDGVPDFGYATDNAGWTHSDAPIVVWSPDSKKLATFQQDQRQVGMMYTVEVTDRHPELSAWRYPLLGDTNVVMIAPVVINVASAKVTRLKMDPEYHRSTLCDDVSCRGGAGWDDVQWAADGRTLALVSTSRDHKDVWLREVNAETGEVRTVFHEHAATYFESGVGKVNWRYLPQSGEVLWFSQRSDWGQMYLYDLKTGQLKNQITHGEGTVTQVLHVDDAKRVFYFLATGKEPGTDPYFSRYYRVSFDGTGQQLLTPENADHVVTPAPDGSTFVDVYSTVETPQTAVLRDNGGALLVTLARQDISALLAEGWKPPTPVVVPARDGKTPLYGFLWKPTHFDAGKKYPVVDYVYPGPFTSSCASRSFHAAEGDNQALAELGFIVVCIDGMGTPFRSKSFQDAYADTPAGLAEATIPDQIAGIRDLARQYSWIDLDRVGIWGHSGGGNATVVAMFRHPEVFKVGVAESGNHDNRDYEDDWDEKYGGLEAIGPDGKSNYDVQANQNFAAGLTGHLLLAHGTADDNVPENNTLLVVDALIKANKTFDLILVPNAHHGYSAASAYMMRRRWDYFVRYLAGGVPPANYQMKAPD